MLVPLYARFVSQLAKKNDQELEQGVVTPFHALRAPSVAVDDYAARILKYSQCSPCCFVYSLILLDRVQRREPSLQVGSLTIHRLVLASVLVASKFLDDFYYNNAYWAKVGGVSLSEINALELEFLFAAGFRLHAQTEEYMAYRCLLYTSPSPRD